MDFQYKITSEAEAKTLSLIGRLDTISARDLETEMSQLIDEPGKSLTVDLSELSYISSSGLRCLVRLFNATRSAKAEFHIEGIQPSVREIFDLTGFTKVFGIK